MGHSEEGRGEDLAAMLVKGLSGGPGQLSTDPMALCTEATVLTG